MLPKPTLEIIETASIIDPKSADRVIDNDHVAHLADSLTEISQMHPIMVKRQSTPPQYLLHDGAHRLLAAIEKGLTTISAQVYDEATPDHHIRRCVLESELTTRKEDWARECLKLQELKSLYESQYPQTKVGGGKGRDKRVLPAFVKHIISMGMGGGKRSTVSEKLTLAKGLGAPLLHLLDQHKLSKDIGKDLLKKTSEERLPIVEKLVDMKRSKAPGRHANLTVAAALDRIKRDAREAACESITLTFDDAKVFHSKMEEYTESAPNTIDAIITDPLYHEDKIPLYGKAAELSASILKPGGFAAFYCGRLHVNRVLGLLGAHLLLRTIIILRHKQHFGNAGSSKISNDSKYILVYQKTGADVDFYTSVPGVIDGTGQEKGNHEYQQSVSDLDNLIDAITQPGETILDLFAGSGTTGVAAIQKGRKTILVEDDAEDCATCCTRLKKALERQIPRPIPFHIPSVTTFLSTDALVQDPDDVSDEDSGELRTAG